MNRCKDTKLLSIIQYHVIADSAADPQSNSYDDIEILRFAQNDVL